MKSTANHAHATQIKTKKEIFLIENLSASRCREIQERAGIGEDGQNGNNKLCHRRNDASSFPKHMQTVYILEDKCQQGFEGNSRIWLSTLTKYTQTENGYGIRVTATGAATLWK